MKVTEWFKLLMDKIMPLEPIPEDDEDVKDTKPVDAKAAEPKPAQAPPVQQQAAQQPAQTPIQSFQAEKQSAAVGGMSQNFSGLGSMNFTRNGGMVSTSESGVASMDGVRYSAYASENPSVRPSLAVVKTPSISVKIYAPSNYDEQVKSIGDDLMKRNAIVVNYESVENDIQQRIGDFILGVVYANKGKVEMISNKIVLYVPDGFDVETASSMAAASMRRY